MIKNKIVKISSIIVCLICVIELFISYLEVFGFNFDGNVIIGLYLFHVLPYLLISIALIIYVIKSIINIINNKIEITFIDLFMLGVFILSFISNVIEEFM